MISMDVLTNIYHGGRLSPQEKSIEHIIPRRLFVNRRHAEDPMNKDFCDRHTNTMRSDYRFGDIASICDPDGRLLIKNDDYQSITDRRCVLTGYISRSRRIFYPSHTCNHRRLSSSILHMLFHYPYLYAYLDQIVCDPVLLSRWSED